MDGVWLLQIVTGRDAVETANWFQRNAGWGWTVALGVVVVFVLAGGWFYVWRYVPLKKRVATAGLRDEDLVTFIYAQAHEAITSLRDVESHKVQDDDVFAFYDFVKACGRWFGRNEHVASLLR